MCLQTGMATEIHIKEMVNEKSVNETDSKVNLLHLKLNNKIQELKRINSHLTGSRFDNL